MSVNLGMHQIQMLNLKFSKFRTHVTTTTHLSMTQKPNQIVDFKTAIETCRRPIFENEEATES